LEILSTPTKGGKGGKKREVGGTKMGVPPQQKPNEKKHTKDASGLACRT